MGRLGWKPINALRTSAQRSEAMKKVWANPAYRRKRSKRSKAMKKQWADPKWKREQGERIRHGLATMAVRDKMGLAAEANWRAGVYANSNIGANFRKNRKAK